MTWFKRKPPPPEPNPAINVIFIGKFDRLYKGWVIRTFEKYVEVGYRSPTDRIIGSSNPYGYQERLYSWEEIIVPKENIVEWISK